MITITKQDNGVLFTFENSDKYLYGNGTIEVPFNTLSIIADESDMITLRKSASNDIFLSARYDSDLGYRSKDDAIDDLKGMLFAEAGGGSESGITSGEVQTMIDESISGKADTAVVNQAISEATQAILSVSGDVQTKVATTDFNTYSAATASAIDGKADTSAVTTVNDALTAHTANTTVHVTSAEKTTWNNKSDFSGDYNDLTNKPTIPTVPTNISDFTNDAGYITNADITGKADTSAVTAISDSLTGKVDTTAITTSITSGSTDSEIPSAKAVFDAIPTGGTGGMDDDMEKLISSSLNDLNDRKIDASEVMTKYQRKGDYATNTALALKANSADVMTLTKSEENEFVAASALVDLNNKFGGLSLVKITESDYTALTTKDDNTLYIVVADPTE